MVRLSVGRDVGLHEDRKELVVALISSFVRGNEDGGFDVDRTGIENHGLGADLDREHGVGFETWGKVPSCDYVMWNWIFNETPRLAVDRPGYMGSVPGPGNEKLAHRPNRIPVRRHTCMPGKPLWLTSSMTVVRKALFRSPEPARRE